MSERRYGFLWDDEREFVDAYRSANTGPDWCPHDETDLTWDEWVEQDAKDRIENHSQIKSRIKTDAASYSVLRDALVAFRKDLFAVQFFYTEILDYPGGQYEFLDRILPALEYEMKRLREQLENWEEWSEQQREYGDSTLDDIGNALEPLHEDLELIKQVQEEGPSSKLHLEYHKANAGREDADPEWVREVEERSKRRKALAVLLSPENGELRELFEWIATHPGQKLPDNKIGGNTWKWWSSTKLKNEHGLAEKSGWGYELTPRGGAVNEALARLDETDAFGPLEEETDYEWTLRLLRFYNAADEWDDV